MILTSEPKAAGGLPRLSPRPQPELGPVFTREDWVGIGGIAGAMVAISWVMGFMWAEYGQIGILGAVAMAIGLFTAVEVFLAARRRGTPSTSAPMTPEDWHRTAVILVLAVFTIFFWMGFEQAGGTLNLFARDRTDRVLLGWEIPAGWFQSINPLLIVGLAPLYSILWGRLARTRFNPSTPVKMATGLLLLGLAFVVMGVASDLAESTGQVGPHWLAIVYLIATMGELCLSPIGLSMVTKLAPLRLASLLMGVWFLAAAVANYTAGTLEAFLLRFDLPLFWTLVATSVVSALVLYLLSPLVNRFMYGRG